MQKTELTKQLLANTLKKLAGHKKVDKISVSEIVEEAGMNRQTFYYHFQDKQELVCWIFDTDVSKLTDEKRDGTLLDDLVVYLHSEKDFYIDALTSDAQNSLREHIFNVCRSRLVDQILRLSASHVLEDSVLNQLSCFFANGLTGSLVQWAQEGMKYESVQSMQAYAPYVNDLLAYAVNRYSNPSS